VGAQIEDCSFVYLSILCVAIGSCYGWEARVILNE